jgi:hypothetical protein
MGVFGYTTTVSLIQFVIFLLKPPLELLEEFDTYELILEFLPPGILYYLKHWYLQFALISFLISLVSLVASLAFLKRRNWARIVLTIVIILPIFICFLGMLYHQQLLIPVPTHIDMREVIHSTNKSIELTLVVFMLLVVLLHTWLAYKLLSKPVREEFQTGSQVNRFL